MFRLQAVQEKELIFPYRYKILNLKLLESILLFCSIRLASMLLGRKHEISTARSYLVFPEFSVSNYTLQKLKIQLS